MLQAKWETVQAQIGQLRFARSTPVWSTLFADLRKQLCLNIYIVYVRNGSIPTSNAIHTVGFHAKQNISRSIDKKSHRSTAHRRYHWHYFKVC